MLLNRICHLRPFAFRNPVHVYDAVPALEGVFNIQVHSKQVPLYSSVCLYLWNDDTFTNHPSLPHSTLYPPPHPNTIPPPRILSVILKWQLSVPALIQTVTSS